MKYDTTHGGQELWRFGFLWRWGSFWVGVHYSDVHKRVCINLVPCFTFWVCAPGGDTPGPWSSFRQP